MKYLGVISLLFFLATMTSCHEENPNLKAAYLYMDSNLPDSAKLCLDRVDVKSLDEAGQAFYYLVKTRWDYVNYIPIAKDDLIQRSVAYYEKVGNDSLLAESLFYQAMILYDNGEVGQALRLLKQADVVAGKCGNVKARHKIVEALAGYNMENGELELALQYAKRTLALSVQLKDPGRIGYAYAYLSEIYDFQGKRDSAYHYLDKCMDYIDYIPLREKGAFYNQVATMYMDIDKKKAEGYVLRGYKLGMSCVGCSLLAQLYHERGELAKADTLFAKALSLARYTRDSVYVLSNMVNAYAGVHDYQRAFSGFKLLYNAHKLLDNTIKENDTKAVQFSFDAEMERLRQSNIFFRIIIGVSLFAMFFFCLWLYRRYRFNEVSRKVVEDELLIRTYQERIEETDISQVKERAHYARKLLKLQERQSRMLAKGRCLYRHIMSGGTIVTWSKDDMKHFMEYFKLVDLSFVKRLEEDYDCLSLRYKFYMVLVHMGKNDEEVQCVMGISPSSVRSIKSRIKSKYKGL